VGTRRRLPGSLTPVAVAAAALLAATPAARAAIPGTRAPVSATRAADVHARLTTQPGVVPAIDPGNALPAGDSLSGISCARASFCVAVGGYHDPLGALHSLAEEWNGSGWRVLPGAVGHGLSGVSRNP
jgi:hypothetical protein